jgi:hypothetical protein
MWTALIALLVAAVVVWIIVSRPTPSQPKREERMEQLNSEPASSYEQKTNHFQMNPVDMGPPVGTETPFRVNMYQSYTT